LRATSAKNKSRLNLKSAAFSPSTKTSANLDPALESRKLMDFKNVTATSWTIVSRGETKTRISARLSNSADWAGFTAHPLGLAACEVDRSHFKYADDFEFVKDNALFCLDSSFILDNLTDPGIIEVRPLRQRGADGKYAVVDRWAKHTQLADMVKLFEDLNPLGFIVSEAYGNPQLCIRFDGLAVNDAMQRAKRNELSATYKTAPSTSIGFLEVTAPDEHMPVVHRVAAAAKRKIAEKFGEHRWGLVHNVRGFKTTVMFARKLTQEDTFAYVDRECRVRFYLQADESTRKEADKINEDLLQQMVAAATERLMERPPKGPVKRGRSDACEDQPRGDNGDAAMGAAGAAAASDDEAGDDEARSVSSEDAAVVAERAESVKTRVDAVRPSARHLLKLLSACGVKEDGRAATAAIIAAAIPETVEAATELAKTLDAVKSPGEIAQSMAKYASRPAAAAAGRPATTWAERVRTVTTSLQTAPKPQPKELNEKAVAPRSKNTHNRSNSSRKKNTPTSTATNRRSNSAARSRSGARS
jgi:hypothetical protein